MVFMILKILNLYYILIIDKKHIKKSKGNERQMS